MVIFPQGIVRPMDIPILKKYMLLKVSILLRCLDGVIRREDIGRGASIVTKFGVGMCVWQPIRLQSINVTHDEL